MAEYATYKSRCRELEEKLLDLRQRLGEDRHEVSIRYLIDSAESLCGAACVLMAMRETAEPASDTDENQ